MGLNLATRWCLITDTEYLDFTFITSLFIVVRINFIFSISLFLFNAVGQVLKSCAIRGNATQIMQPDYLYCMHIYMGLCAEHRTFEFLKYRFGRFNN